VTALVLDAGALIAVDRNDRAMIARLRIAQLHGYDLRTSAIVISQVWRSPVGKQARLARLLSAMDVRPVDEQMGRDAGLLLRRTGTEDPIDATVVLVSRTGDRILTSDPGDIGHLASRSGRRIVVVAC